MSTTASAGLIGLSEFKFLFEHAPGAYLVLLPDFTIAAASHAYLKVSLKEREQITGKNLFAVFPELPDGHSSDTVSNLRASLDYVLKNKTTHIMPIQQYNLAQPDGSFEEHYWSPLNKPVLNDKNEVIFIIHRVEDVTDFLRVKKEKTEKTEIQLQQLGMEIEIFKRSEEINRLNEELEQKVNERTAELDSVNKIVSDYKFALDESSIVAITDQKGIIKNVNDNFCKISKYSRTELIGQDHRIINSGHHSKQFIRDLWVTIANGKIWKGELKNKAKDGTIYWVDTTIVPFLDEKGKPYQYVAIRSDITQRKQGEQEILKMKAELEDKVTARTLELTQSLEREKELNEMKSRFVSIASHEFRTPLSSILSSTSLLEKYTAPENAEKRDKHFERIKISVKNLTEILEDFLSIDKLEQGKTEVKLEAIDLGELVENIKGAVEGMQKEGQVLNYKSKGEPGIISDGKILRNILLNLITNAIKYSGENKSIELETETTTEKILIKIKDYGIGIPEEEQKSLFKMFFRAKNAEIIQGTGLGLTIVKRYVELLGGTISFRSVLNKGTTFELAFPKKQP
jgi:PAS domain S-box-containing protein